MTFPGDACICCSSRLKASEFVISTDLDLYCYISVWQQKATARCGAWHFTRAHLRDANDGDDDDAAAAAADDDDDAAAAASRVQESWICIAAFQPRPLQTAQGRRHVEALN